MSRFVTIKHIEDYELVSYYSVCYEDEEESLFEQFLVRFADDPATEKEVVQLVYWLQKIGDDIGAKDRYFRPEERASALPPPRYIENDAGDLRLYCFVASENVVFLFDGGIKTTQRAQDCPNVASHFRLANKLSKAINQCFIDGDIQWKEGREDIEYTATLDILLP